MLGGALAAATIESCVAAIARTREVFVVDTPRGTRPQFAGPASRGKHRSVRTLAPGTPAELTAQTVDVMGHGLGASIAVESVCDRIEHLLLVSPESILPPLRVTVAGIRRRRWPSSTDVRDTARYLDATTGAEYVPDPSISTWFAKVTVYCVPPAQPPTFVGPMGRGLRVASDDNDGGERFV